MLGLKTLFIGVYLIQSVLVLGQKMELTDVKNDEDVNAYLKLRLSQLQSTDLVISGLYNDWKVKSEAPKQYMSITHVPENDFNIYLSFNNSITPNILASFEVSLNYAGVMNIRSLIVLRK